MTAMGKLHCQQISNSVFHHFFHHFLSGFINTRPISKELVCSICTPVKQHNKDFIASVKALDS